MVPPHGLVLAAGVVGSEDNSLGTGKPVHGDRRGIISAILTTRRGMKFLWAARLISIGRLRLPRPVIHTGGAGPRPSRAGWRSNEKSCDSEYCFHPGQFQSERLELRKGGGGGY